MTGYPWTAWLWWIGGAALGLLGLWLLYWSFLHDRSKGRRRCPKCWYNMSGTDSMTCSECGRTVKREKKLYKTRRRWRWAFAAMLFLLVAYGSALTPKIRRDGWIRAAPTLGLIILANWCDGGYSNEPKWKHDLLEELLVRLLMDGARQSKRGITATLSTWQWSMFLRIADRKIPRVADLEDGRMVADHRNAYTSSLMEALPRGTFHHLGLEEQFIQQFPVSIELDLHGAWPTSWPFYADYWIKPTLGEYYQYEVKPVRCTTSDGKTLSCQDAVSYSQDLDWFLDDPPLEIDLEGLTGLQEFTVEFEVFVVGMTSDGEDSKLLPLGSAITRFTVFVDGNLTDYLVPIDDAEADDFIRSCASWEITEVSEQDWRFILTFPRRCSDNPPAWTITPRVELVHDGNVVMSTVAIMHYDYGVSPHYGALFPKGGESFPPSEPGESSWVLRLIGDPTGVLREGRTGEFWAGRVEFPIHWRQEDGRWIARSTHSTDADERD